MLISVKLSDFGLKVKPNTYICVPKSKKDGAQIE